MHTIEEPVITMPTSEQLAAMLQLRAEVYEEEARLSGISPEALSHVRRQLQDDPHWRQQFRDNTLALMQNPEERIFFRTVILGAEVVGLCVGNRAAPSKGHNYLSVLQLSHKIRRQGIGSQLMRDFGQITDPALPTRLHVLLGNLPAIKFYRKHGFDFTGQAKTFPYGPESAIALEMEKKGII